MSLFKSFDQWYNEVNARLELCEIQIVKLFEEVKKLQKEVEKK